MLVDSQPAALSSCLQGCLCEMCPQQSITLGQHTHHEGIDLPFSLHSHPPLSFFSASPGTRTGNPSAFYTKDWLFYVDQERLLRGNKACVRTHPNLQKLCKPASETCPALTSEEVFQEDFIPWDDNDMGGLAIRGNHSKGPFCGTLGKP